MSQEDNLHGSRGDELDKPSDGSRSWLGSFNLSPTEFTSTDPRAVWKRYCSFLDLSYEEFMDIQEELLMEQVQLVGASPLGRRLFRGKPPASLTEFRETIPLTTYGDYLPQLSPGNDHLLGGFPVIWAHTTGAQAKFKWVPYTQRGLERLLDNLMAAFILAAATRREDVRVWPGDTILFNTPERPYVSGLVTFGMAKRFGFRGVLDPELSESLDFKDRMRLGFEEALSKRVDVIISMSSVLAKMGVDFGEHSNRTRFSRRYLKPRALLRVARALVKRRLLRKQIMPKDLWPSKAIIGWGIDTPYFQASVERYWGKPAFQLYACTEGAVMGMQTWESEGCVFSPYADFFEFIPLEESLKSREDTRYRPKTILLDEIEPGNTYELVITNFYGMPFIRYRLGHLIQFLNPGRPKQQSGLPRFTFVGRADDRIDLAGFTRIDEKSIWEALSLSRIELEDWTARKEIGGNSPVLHLYIELKKQYHDIDVANSLHEAMKQIDPFYRDLETMLNIRPIRVTKLRPGSFDLFYDGRRAAGFELGRRRPSRMNPIDDDIDYLLRISSAP